MPSIYRCAGPLCASKPRPFVLALPLAILTRLMRDAVEERKRQKRRITAINAILRLRAKSVAVSDDEIRNARKIGRP